ncbi:MAG: hypothetical protein HY288_19715 [Planctomycetia bacterium]|nr:hypothetical protein [Planctomycetia bacterium]
MSQPTNPTPPPINPYDVRELRRPGMSTTSKVFLGLGVGCAVILMLCCGGLGFSGYALVRIAKNSTVHDPRQIEDILDEIVTIQVPDSLTPTIGINVDLPVLGPFLKGVLYQDAKKKSMLLVGRFNPSFANRDTFETQLRSSVEERDSEDIEVSESESLDMKIHDEPAHFSIARGTGRESHEESWEVIGQFEALDGGPAILIFKGRTVDFTKDQVLDMLKSMN